MPESSAPISVAAEIPRWTWIGISAAVVLYVAAALFSAITLPWKGSADSFAHMDYVYQVHHGRLPAPFGYQYRKVDLREFNIGNADNTNQWAASHPPLFYYIASLQMGSSLDSGKWQVAVKRGRLLNVVIGLLCVVSLSWAGWRLGGRYRTRLAVALPAIAGMLPMFIRLAGEIYNDLLVTLFSILAVTLSCCLVSEGPKGKRLFWLAIVSALGMASKATFVLALVLGMCAVFLSFWKQAPPRRFLAFLKGLAASALLAFVAVAPIFWFYLLNFRASGSWFLSTPRIAIQNRRHSSALEVLGNDDFWLLVPRNLLGSNWNSTWPINEQLSVWLCAICALALAFLFVSRGYWRKIMSLDGRALVWFLLTAHFAGFMFAQWRHATGWGALNFRYFIPALLSMGLFLTMPMVAWQRMSGWLVATVSALLAVSGVMVIITYLDRRYATIAAGEGSWTRLLATVEGNDISSSWVWITLSTMTIALVAVGLAVARSHDVATTRG